MITKSLNDIPYQVYLDNIVPFIEIKDAGSLTMTSKSLKEIFDRNDIWKQLYFKTNPPQILDTSIHIGPHIKDKHLNKKELLEKYNVCKPIYWPQFGNIQRPWSKNTCCCIGIDHLIPSLIDINNNINIGNLDTTLHYINEQPLNVRNEYYKIIKKIHIKKNTLDNLNTVNLCRNKSHYIESSLGFNNENDAKYESFKEVTIKKLRTKYNKKLTTEKYKLENQNKKIIRLMNEVIKQCDKLKVIKENHNRLTKFAEKSNISIDIYKKKKKKKKKKKLDKDGNPHILDKKQWNICWDYTSLKWYYYNRITTKSQWNRPL
jgi:hypothetical protein